MRATITEAIRGKRLLSFTYDGHPRVVEPHCYGITTAGNEGLRCFQVAGTGVRPGGSPWHMMTTSKIMSLTLSEETFVGPRKGYKKGDRGMSSIFCEL